MNILVLDDEKEIADLVELYMKNEGYNVFKFYDSNEALECINTTELDLAILDIMIKDVNGFEVCQFIRNKGLNFPIIMLSAKIADKDKIQGLSLGADDYVTKPFNPLELVARVKSAFRRYTLYNGGGAEAENDNIIYIDGLEIDSEKHICKLYDKKLELTPTEFDILLFLAQNIGNVVSSEEIFEQVWKEKYLENNNTVMVHIRRLREKMGEDKKKPKYIKTVWGVGYKIDG
ncbi:MAG: VanR-ABDEGLN family response regulator transcription factor [Clostridia bacterium]|nr:VanR-ABDEGLN family response regulator transcription factor [Clostridia bacterium]